MDPSLHSDVNLLVGTIELILLVLAFIFVLTWTGARSKALLAVSLGIEVLGRFLWLILWLGQRFDLFDEPWELFEMMFWPNVMLRMGSVVLLLVFVLIMKEELRQRSPVPAVPAAPGGWS